MFILPFNHDKLVDRSFKKNDANQTVFYAGRRVHLIKDEASEAELKTILKSRYKAIIVLMIIFIILGTKLGLTICLPALLYLTIRDRKRLKELLKDYQKLTWKESRSINMSIQAGAYNIWTLRVLLVMSLLLFSFAMFIILKYHGRGCIVGLPLALIAVLSAFMWRHIIGLKKFQEKAGEKSHLPEKINPR